MNVVHDKHGNRRHTVYTTRPLIDGEFDSVVRAHIFIDCKILVAWAKNSTRGPTPHKHDATELYNLFDHQHWGLRVKVDGAKDITYVCANCVRRAWRTGETRIGNGP